MTNWLKFSTGIKVCEIVKDLGIVFISRKRLPLKMCIQVICFWNANAHGRLYLRSSSSTYEDNSTCMKDITKIMTCIMKNGRLQDDQSAEVIIAHAEFIIASQNSRKRSRRPSSLSVTTQRTKCIKSESCKH